MLTCKKKQIEIEFNGNEYKEFFFYPHPEDNNQIASYNAKVKANLKDEEKKEHTHNLERDVDFLLYKAN